MRRQICRLFGNGSGTVEIDDAGCGNETHIGALIVQESQEQIKERAARSRSSGRRKGRRQNGLCQRLFFAAQGPKRIQRRLLDLSINQHDIIRYDLLLDADKTPCAASAAERRQRQRIAAAEEFHSSGQ